MLDSLKNTKIRKAPRHLLADIAKDNPRLVRYLENLQSMTFDDLPVGIADVLNQANLALQQSIQASQMASQILDNQVHYLQPVDVPMVNNPVLVAV